MERVARRTAVKEKTLNNDLSNAPDKAPEPTKQKCIGHFACIPVNYAPSFPLAGGTVQVGMLRLHPIRRRVDGLLLAACFAKRLKSGGKTETIGF